MSSPMSEEKQKSSHASHKPRAVRKATGECDDSVPDNSFLADPIPDNRTYRPYPSKYGVIFAQLATRERMEREGVRELEEREEREGKEREKVKKKQEEEKGGEVGREKLDEGEDEGEEGKRLEHDERSQKVQDDDDDDGWETADYSEDEMND